MRCLHGAPKACAPEGGITAAPTAYYLRPSKGRNSPPASSPDYFEICPRFGNTSNKIEAGDRLWWVFWQYDAFGTPEDGTQRGASASIALIPFPGASNESMAEDIAVGGG